MGYRRRNFNQWPGNGPFSNLPPWQRPGQRYGGRGRGYYPRMCSRFPWLPRWWWANPTYAYQPQTFTSYLQNEIATLEESKKTLGEEKSSIEQEINDIETQLKQLKAKLEAEKNQTTNQ